MSGAKILLFCRLSLFTKYHKMFKIAVSFSGGVLETKRGCVISLWRTLFVFSSFSRYGTEKIVFIYNKAQTFTSSGFAFPQKFCIFAENFFKYGKDTNKI